MALAATATRAELLTAFNAINLLSIQLRQIIDGSGSPAAPGRFTSAQIDAQIDVVQAALTAVEA